MQQSSLNTITAEKLFCPGSWWIWNNELLVAGGPAPGLNPRFASENRVYLYRMPQSYNHAQTYCIGFLTFIAALRKIETGEIRPCLPDDLSVWPEAEQEYYRTG